MINKWVDYWNNDYPNNISRSREYLILWLFYAFDTSDNGEIKIEFKKQILSIDKLSSE